MIAVPFESPRLALKGKGLAYTACKLLPKIGIKNFSAGAYFCNFYGTQYTFHVEATTDPSKLIRQIKEAGMKVGIAVKPKTPVEAILPFIDEIDMALVMTVEPGFGGQKFMADMMPKVKILRERFPILDIEVDGGVGPSNIGDCAAAGANVIVSGTAVTSSEIPGEILAQMRDRVENEIRAGKKSPNGF